MDNTKKCSVCGSTHKVIKTKIGLLCGKHYQQFKKHGKIGRSKYDPNKIKLYEDYAVIELYNNNNEVVGEAIVDIDCIDIVKSYKWCLDKNGYVKNSKQEYLHRVIVNTTNLYVDHINGNTLDNRKNNLRICTNADNLKHRVNLPINNTSGILGIRYRKDRNKWYAEIQSNGEKINLGSYITKEEAIRARLNAEIKYFKEYKSNINEINKTIV